ncbi:MAG: hypothetical protein ACO1OX_02635 [Novosphingobium sp.]
MAQTQTGTTVNANVSVNSLTGLLNYAFVNPFNMLINLQNASGVTVTGSALDDKINLLNATGVTINGGGGNNIYTVSAAAGGLNDNIIRGGTRFDFVTLSGSNTSVDLAQGSTGVEAVVSSKEATGESVVVSLNQMAGSALTNGGTGRAFAAVVGSTGSVNVVASGKFQFVGVVDAAGQGFSATGQAIVGTALTNLKQSVTQISQITGNLAALYAASPDGSVPAGDTYIAENLRAYVFSDGSKSYTVWSDGVVSPVDTTGAALPAVYQPAAIAPVTVTPYGSVSAFNKAGNYGSAQIYTDANGLSHLRVDSGSSTAAAAINLKSFVADTAVHGDSGKFGANYFGLGGSGGNNLIFGSTAGNVFDLQLSATLQDKLIGTAGFDIVKASANGADVDLTASNGATGKASTFIDAVVGSNNLANVQTVKIDANTIRYATDASGAKVGVFSALLGSDADTLSLAGGGKWIQIADFAGSAPLPEHAVALTNAAALDAEFGPSTHKAATSLHGFLFQQVDLKGNVIKYLTVYTDATLDNQLAAPVASASKLSLSAFSHDLLF